VNDQVVSAGPTTDPAVALLRGGGIPALLTCVGVAACCLPVGPSAAGSAALGGGMAIIALAVGPLLLRLGRDWTSVGLMALAVTGYGAVVFFLAVVFLLLSNASWLLGGYAALGVVACTSGWLAGQLRSTHRLRVLAFGDERDAGRDSDAGTPVARSGSTIG
jgi:hypothetical protein